jgi:alkylhydroperoxidase family enzyme
VPPPVPDQPPSDPPISRFGVPALAELPDDLRARIAEVEAKTGFIPNVFLALARRPAEFRAFFAFYDALMLREGGLTPRQQAMLDAALVLAVDPGAFGAVEIARLQAHGFGQEDIWDIGAITALFALSNRLAHLTDLQPNPEFHLLGRLPKADG